MKDITLVIVDDSAVHRQLLRALTLQMEGFELLFEAKNGADLLERLEISEKLPDVCILDMHMPVMNGIQTLNVLSTQYPSVKSFGYTSCSDENEIAQMLENGAIKVFSKLDVMQIFSKIREYLNENQH